MARMRSIKPEYWDDEELATTTSRDARLLYPGLWNLADEHGRLRGDPRYIKGKIFAYDDDLTPKDVDELIEQLARIGKVVRYRVDGAQYLYLPKLAKHQRLEADKVPSRLPGPSTGSGPEFPPRPPAQVGPDEPESDANKPAPNRTGNADRWTDSGHSDPGQPESGRANKSAQDADESAPGAKDHALKHVAGSMEHVAGSRAAARAQAAAGPRAIVIDATGATEPEADQLITRVKRERQPRALVPFLRRMAADGDLAEWLAELRGTTRDLDREAAFRAIRDGPACEHGQPGGALTHPDSGEPICALCRRKARLRIVEPAVEPAVEPEAS